MRILKNTAQIIGHLKKYPDEVLQAFLRADAAKEVEMDDEILLLIMEELANRRKIRGESPDAHAALERFRKYYFGAGPE